MSYSTPEITLGNPNFDEMEQDIAMFASIPSVNEVLCNGVDLKNYKTQINAELQEAEHEALESYLSQIELSGYLYEQVCACDEALGDIEVTLDKFKSSIGQLSTDICALQTRSQSITIKLGNKKALESQLGVFASDVTISSQFIHQIVNGEVGVGYIKVLEELHRKISFSKKKDVRNTPAAQEAKQPLDVLRMKASENIRKWLIDRINEIKLCYGTELFNIQTRLLKCRYLIRFLKSNSSDVEESVRNYYIQIMSRIYLENFRMLTKRIIRQMSPLSTARETLIPILQTGFWKTKRIIGEATQFFSLGDRQRLLNELLSPPQPFGDGTYPCETLIRSLYQTLIDSFTSEHLFCSSFFDDTNVGILIFGTTVRFLEKFIETLISRITDPICILFLLRFSISHKNEMNRRTINLLEAHLNGITNKYAERFRMIIRENIETLQQIDPQMFLENPTTCHHVTAMTKRFSEFCSSITQLIHPDLSNYMMTELYHTSEEVYLLLGKISRQMSTKELSIVFLINNYYHILITLQNVGGGPLYEGIEKKNMELHKEYIDYSLEGQFSELMSVVKRGFSTDDIRENPIRIDISEKDLKDIATDFREKHTQKLKMIIDSQNQKLCDNQNAQEISQKIAKRITFIWARFEQLLKTNSKGGVAPSWWSQMTTLSQLVTDIRPLTKPF